MKFKPGAGILGILVLLVGGYVGMTLTKFSTQASQTSSPDGTIFILVGGALDVIGVITVLFTSRRKED